MEEAREYLNRKKTRGFWIHTPKFTVIWIIWTSSVWETGLEISWETKNKSFLIRFWYFLLLVQLETNKEDVFLYSSTLGARGQESGEKVFYYKGKICDLSLISIFGRDHLILIRTSFLFLCRKQSPTFKLSNAMEKQFNISSSVWQYDPKSLLQSMRPV